MTLQEAKTLHAFNSWADNRIFEALAQVPADQYMKDLRSSHGGIHGTMVHLVGAQKMWVSRWRGSPDATYLSAAEAPSLGELKAVWEKAGFETARFLGTLTDKKLGDTITVTMSTGQSYTNTIAQTLQHIVDHSTYHRGQIVAMMRQLGIKPPSTGMIGFFRETAKLQ